MASIPLGTGCLRQMLKVCEKFIHDFDITFNPGKSKMVLFNAEQFSPCQDDRCSYSNI